MKKRFIEALAILGIAMGGGFLLPNFFKNKQSIEWPGVSDFSIWTVSISIIISIIVYVNKPRQKKAYIPDGYNELYNANNQITKKGIFNSGIQISGTQHVYKKNGVLSHIETCTDGVYTKDISKS